ncbi:hypothetical protein KI387_018171, partial [Taxus chinensis]
EEVSAMLRSILLESEQGIHCVNVKQSLSSLTQNIVCRMFSSRTYSDDELSGGMVFREMVSEISAVAGAFCIGDYIPFLDWLDLQGLRRRMRAVDKVFDGFAEKVIDEHINCRREKERGQEDQGVKDIVDVLLNMAESESQGKEMKITRVHIKAIIMDILSAGVETTSTTLEWAISELIRNPYVMEKAQQEIDLVASRHRLLKESDVAHCEYLRCIVKETFRLHPPAPLLLPHESMRACSVNGYYIPPRTILFVNIWAMGRDDSIWDDPLQFKPERFIGKKIDVQGQDFDLLPFGTGRRGCPGISMGISVIELALAELIHCFDWHVEDELNMDEVFGLTVPKKFPLCARPSW